MKQLSTATLLLLLSACGGTTTSPANPPPPKVTLTVTPPSIIVDEGTKATIKVEVQGSTNKKVDWRRISQVMVSQPSTNDPSTWEIQALSSVGSHTLQVYPEANHNILVDVPVTIKPKISLTVQTNGKITVGSTLNLTTTDKVSWQSNNPGIAEITAAGLVIAKTAGKVTFTGHSTTAGDFRQIQTTLQVVDFARYKQVITRSNATCGLTPKGTAECWGSNANTLSITPPPGENPNGITLPLPVNTPETFTELTSSWQFQCGLNTNQKAICWGDEEESNLGHFGDDPAPVKGNLSFKTIAAGDFHACGITLDNMAYCWGRSLAPRNNLDPVDHHMEPRAYLSSATAVASGSSHSCALTETGKVTCWGRNYAGQLGFPAEPYYNQKPHEVAFTLPFKQVTAFSSTTCANATDGTWWCWGDNEFGQLGNSKTQSTHSPQQVHRTLTWKTVRPGMRHTCGLTTDGKVYCWGMNTLLGIGKTDGAPILTPQEVKLPEKIAGLAVGWDHTCGWTETGITYCWGHNSHGQMGNGTTYDALFPTRVEQRPQ